MTNKKRVLISLAVGVALAVAALLLPEFWSLSPLRKILTLLALAGAPSVLDFLLRAIWPPETFSDKDIEKIGKHFEKILSDRDQERIKQGGAREDSPLEAVENTTSIIAAAKSLRESAQGGDDLSKIAFEKLLAADTQGAREILGKKLEKERNRGEASHQEAANTARNLAAITWPDDVYKAAELHDEASKLYPTDEGWIDLGNVFFLAANRVERLREQLRTALDAYKGALARQDNPQLTEARNLIAKVLDTIKVEAEKEGKLGNALKPHLHTLQELTKEGMSDIEYGSNLFGNLKAIESALAQVRDKYCADSRDAYGRLIPLPPQNADQTTSAERQAKEASTFVLRARERLGEVLEAIGDRWRTHDDDEALEAYRGSLENRDRLAAAGRGPADLKHALAVVREKIGDALLDKSRPLEALKTYRDRAIAQRRLDADAENVTRQRDLAVLNEKIDLIESAQVTNKEGLSEAHESYKRALEFYDTLREGEWGPRRAVLNEKLGDVFVAQGELAKARSSYKASKDAFDQSARAHNKFGDVLLAIDDPVLALVSYNVALSIRSNQAQSNGGMAMFCLALSHESIADAHAAQVAPFAAATSYKVAIDIVTKICESDPTNRKFYHKLSTLQEKYADMLVDQNWKRNQEEALRYYTMSEAIRENLVDRNDIGSQRDLARSHERIGDVYRRQGVKKDAFERWEKALRIYRELVNPSDPLLVEALWRVGELKPGAGKTELQEAEAILLLAGSLKDSDYRYGWREEISDAIRKL